MAAPPPAPAIATVFEEPGGGGDGGGGGGGDGRGGPGGLGGGEGAAFGHHVLHARVPSDYKEHIMNQQREELLKLQPYAFTAAEKGGEKVAAWAQA